MSSFAKLFKIQSIRVVVVALLFLIIGSATYTVVSKKFTPIETPILEYEEVLLDLALSS